MIGAITFKIWSLSDEKQFLDKMMDRFKGKSTTTDRFGTPVFFIEQYLEGLNLRILNFNGTGTLEPFERAAMREYAEGLLLQRGVEIPRGREAGV
jgi:hypothetical protein